VSAIIIVAGAVSILLHKGLNESIDFSGGALVEIALEKPVPVQDVRAIIEHAGFGGAEITRFGQESSYLIKVKELEAESVKGANAAAPTDSKMTPDSRGGK